MCVYGPCTPVSQCKKCKHLLSAMQSLFTQEGQNPTRVCRNYENRFILHLISPVKNISIEKQQQLNVILRKFQEKRRLRKIRSIDKKPLREEIYDLCKNLFSYNLDGLVNAYNNTRKSALDHHTPVITKIVVKRPTVPQFNVEVKSAKKEKMRTERKWCRTRLHSDLLDFKSLCQ